MSEKPEEKLKDLKNNLEKTDTEIGELAKQKDTLKTDITALEKIVSEVKQVLSAYGQELPNIEIQKKAIENYSKTKTPMIEVAIKDKKEAIDKKVEEFDGRTKNMEEQVKRLKIKFEDADTQYEDAQKNLKDKQYTYDSLKAFQKEIGGKLKELKNLRESIEKYEEKNETAKMYFLMSELNSLLGNTVIKTSEGLESELYKKWKELDSAKTALRDREEQLKDARNNFENKQKELESRKKNRRDEILKIISEM